MPKRLSNIQLHEVSLVDSPANKGARVSLYKRDPIAKIDREPLVEVCKGLFDEDRTSDFREALADELRNQRIMEIQDEMFPLMDALRESVMTAAAELSGEQRDNKIRENVEQFLQSVRSKLDGQEPEPVQARDPRADTETRGLVKRLAAHFGLVKTDPEPSRSTERGVKPMRKAVSDALESAVQSAAESRAADNDDLTVSQARSQIIEEMAQATGSSDSERARGGQITTGTVNSIIRGEIENPPADRLRAFAGVLGVSADSLINELDEEVRNSADKRAGSPGTSNPSGKGATMSEDMKKELGDLKAQVDQLTKQVEAVTSQAEQHGLTVEKTNDGSIKLRKADDDYIEFNGEKIAKSAVPSSVLKAIEAQQEETRKLREDAQWADLRKRAEDRWPNVPGEPVEKARILKAIEAAETTEARDKMLADYDQLDKALGEQMRERGSTGHGNTGTEAMAKLDTMAKERAEKTGENYNAAYAGVLKTDAGAQLYDQYTRERAA